MSHNQQQAIADEVMAALESQQFDLPTLPDMAARVRDLIDDPNVSAEQLVNQIASDPAISAHIIKMANSAAFSGGVPTATLRGAITRLGYRMLRNLVMTITMSKLFQADSPTVNRQLTKLWEHSREVAASSYVLALYQKHLKPEQAMLAGLVHDIGALPLCIYADRHHPRLDQQALENLIRKFGSTVGTQLLRNWHFPDELVEVVAGHENLQRIGNGELPDYVDVVTIANLQMQGRAKFVAWQNVAAASRMGCDVSACQNFLDTYAAQLSIAREMLGIKDAPAAANPVPPAPDRAAARKAEAPGKTAPGRKEASGKTAARNDGDIFDRLLQIFK